MARNRTAQVFYGHPTCGKVDVLALCQLRRFMWFAVLLLGHWAGASPLSAQRPHPGARLRVVPQTGHLRRERVSSFTISEDERYAATASEAEIIVWDINTGAQLLVVNDSGMADAALSRSGDYLSYTTSSVPSQVVVRHADDEGTPWRLEGSGHSWSPISDRLALASGATVIICEPSESGGFTPLTTLNTGDSLVSLAFSPDERVLAGANRKGALSLWSLATGERLASWQGTTEKDFSGRIVLEFASDGGVLIATLPQSWVRHPQRPWMRPSRWISVWSVSTRGLAPVEEPNDSLWRSSAVYAVARDRSKVLVGDSTESDIVLLRDSYGEEAAVRATRIDWARFSSRGTYVSVLTDGKPAIYSGLTGEHVRMLGESGDYVTDVDVAATGDVVVATTQTGTLQHWSLRASQMRWSKQVGVFADARVAVSLDGAYAVVSGEGPGRGEGPGTPWLAEVWSLELARRIHSIKLTDVKTPYFADSRVTGVCVSPDSRYFYVAHHWGLVRRFELRTGEVVDSLFAGKAVNAIALSVDGDVLATAGDSAIDLFATRVRLSPATGPRRRISLTFEPGEGFWEPSAYPWEEPKVRQSIEALAFRDSVSLLVGGPDGSLTIIDTSGTLLYRHQVFPRGIRSIAKLSGGVVVVGDSRLRLAWNSEIGTKVGEWRDGVLRAKSDPGGNLLVFGVGPTVRVVSGKDAFDELTLVRSGDSDWLAFDHLYRFDASRDLRRSPVAILAGMERLETDQLRGRFYRPNLIAEALTRRRRIEAPAPGYDRVLLPPQVVVVADTTTSRATVLVKNRGGGIGRVALELNGKEISHDADQLESKDSADSLLIHLPLAGHPFLARGRENLLSVIAYDRNSHLSSPVATVDVGRSGTRALAPTMWVLAVGVSDYRGEDLDLRFASQDAQHFAEAVRIAGQGILPSASIKVTVLNGRDGSSGPTRQQIVSALNRISTSVTAADIVVLYFAGHGVVEGGPGGDYYFLTQEAATTAITDPWLRAATTVSGRELAAFLKGSQATKQILILDTCGAGRVIPTIASRAGDPNREQAEAITRLQSGTGVYILAGSAADARAYESSAYGNGVLTYSLLLGMKGPALRDGGFLGVARWLTDAAERVPRLAMGVHGLQHPELAIPRGGRGFDIGRLDADARQRIVLSGSSAVFVRSTFQSEDDIFDGLGLSGQVDHALSSRKSQGPSDPLYLDVADYPSAYSIVGRYRVSEQRVSIRVMLMRDAARVAEWQLEGNVRETAALSARILDATTRAARADIVSRN